MSVNKLERLLNLTAVLLDTTRPLTAEDLRQKVEGYPPPGPAFHRTFERDKDDLRVMGIPLRVEKVPATDPPLDGYRIAADDYYLSDPGLDPAELAALHLASLTVRLEGFGEREALWKLGGVAQDRSTGADLGASSTGAIASIPADPALEPLFGAIAAHEVVAFEYRSSSGDVEQRLVEPWWLDFHRGRWYLTGRDKRRDAERNFRLDRITGPVTTTGEPVGSVPTRSAGGPRQPWELGSEKSTTAKLLVDATHAANVARDLGDDSVVETRADGSMLFDVAVVRFDAFRSYVLSLLDHCELLEPIAWRNDLVTWLRECQEPADAEGAQR